MKLTKKQYNKLVKIKAIRPLKDIYIFDVDGTLTDSRQPMNAQFKKWFLQWIKQYDNEVYLVTGSDYAKTKEQVGSQILTEVDASFNCSGNSIWKNGKEIYTTSWRPSQQLQNTLTAFLRESKFLDRSDRFIELRPGMVNFSVVGRGCTPAQRSAYIAFDKRERERLYFAQTINKNFPDLVASVAGETGIDIFPKGKDKAQVLDYFKENSQYVTLHFFGDKMRSNGNDRPLADAIKKEYNGEHVIVPVLDWNDTFDWLQKYGTTKRV